VVGPAVQVVGPSPDVTVEAPPRCAWDEKRWQLRVLDDQRIAEGHYRVRDRRGQWREFRGQVVAQGRDIKAYIADPPSEMRQHPHGNCLQLVQPPWFLLHWNRAPKSMDDALLYMERMLHESFHAYGG
jgi:hypothetical protein